MTKLGDIYFRQPLSNKRKDTEYVYYGEQSGNTFVVNPEELHIITSGSNTYAILNEGILNNSLENFEAIWYGTSLDSLSRLGTSNYSVNPDTAIITFSSLPSGSNLHFYASYKGVGSMVWAEDVVSLQQATNVIDEETLYKDGSVVMTGDLAMGGHNINNVNNINMTGNVDGVNISSHNHSGGQGGLIETNSIVNFAITTSKIADGAVTNSKITDGAVTNDKIQDGTIEFSKFNKVSLLNALYPVGSIYISLTNTCPIAAALGGTWTKIENKFLLGASSTYSLNSTGGEETHTLTVDEIPSHDHNFTVYARNTNANGSGALTGGQDNDFIDGSYSGTTAKSGGSQAHNNMPPYIAVNIFRRTA